MKSDVDEGSMTAATMRRVAFEALIKRQGEDLTKSELGYVLGPRWPTGDLRNRQRGVRIRMLQRRGFTCEGERISGGWSL